jgi:hypothetical protein
MLLKALLCRPVIFLLLLLFGLPLRLLLRRGAGVEYALYLVPVPLVLGTVDKGADSVVNQHRKYNRDTESEGNFLSYHNGVLGVLQKPKEKQDQRRLAGASFLISFLLPNFTLLFFKSASGWLHRVVRWWRDHARA